MEGLWLPPHWASQATGPVAQLPPPPTTLSSRVHPRKENRGFTNFHDPHLRTPEYFWATEGLGEELSQLLGVLNPWREEASTQFCRKGAISPGFIQSQSQKIWSLESAILEYSETGKLVRPPMPVLAVTVSRNWSPVRF